jgi:hypothetical protein
MRWKKPKYGSIRYVRRFFFLPTIWDNEYVWLEFYYQKQRYDCYDQWSILSVTRKKGE